jgi:hypothetical protein
MVMNPSELETLAEKGVNRIVLSLPTAARDESLKTLDGYTDILEWARHT